MVSTSGEMSSGIGSSVKRREDHRFLTGNGRYTDDITQPGQVYAHIVRSPYAHARITSLNIQEAQHSAGIITVLTGHDMVADGINGLPCGWQIHSKDQSAMKEPPHLPLVIDYVRHVGDPIVLVLAETRHQARDAAERIMIDYEELPAVVSTVSALADHAIQIHPAVPGNLCFDWHLGDESAVADAFANATHITKLELINNRLIPNAIEPRAALCIYHQADESYTLYTTSQNPHLTRLLMSAFVLHIPEHKLRVIAPDVGGGFGSKIYHYAEEVLVTWAARKINRPVKWTAERSESFMSDAHGRDHVTTAQLALDSQGHFLGLRVSTIANMGAYLSTFAPAIPTYLYGTLLAGQYTTPAIYCEVKAVFTNTVPVDAYRGAGRPEACYLVERLVETAAREMGIDKVEIRRRNMIRASAMPYQTPVAVQYDCGHFEHNLDLALPIIDYQGFEVRKAKSLENNKLRGIGLSTYIEACGLAPSNLAGALGARAGLYESAEIRFHPTGSVSVFTGSHSHGQGHETTFAQLVSDRFNIALDNITVIHGDTGQIPFGMGTYGSRSIAVGGSAIAKALDKIEVKAKKIAAHILEVNVKDIELKDGRFGVIGTDKSLSIGEIAFSAYVPHHFPLDSMEPGLDEQAFYDPTNFTFPNGCQICEVEIDPQTGLIAIVDFVCVDDFGRVINPMIVEGQVHGGLVQGIGQALFEDCIYDRDTGQLITASYMDYCLPHAHDVPSFKVHYHEEALCTHNPLGVKGCGEAGTIGAPAAVINAVVDALAQFGITDITMPATPERIWRTIQSAQTH